VVVVREALVVFEEVLLVAQLKLESMSLALQAALTNGLKGEGLLRSSRQVRPLLVVRWEGVPE